MSPELMLVVALVTVITLFVVALAVRRLPKRVKSVQYVKKWRDIQKLCSNKDDWSHAIIHADMLLDEVLRKKKLSGKTMGERMVNAQGRFSVNDAVWDAHKLANAIRQDGTKTIKEDSVKNALVAFRQALRDLGALK